MPRTFSTLDRTVLVSNPTVVVIVALVIVRVQMRDTGRMDAMDAD